MRRRRSRETRRYFSRRSLPGSHPVAPRKPLILRAPVAKEEYGKTDLAIARDNLWHYRIVMNPRLTLRGMWFPRSVALKGYVLGRFQSGQAPGDAADDAAAARQVAQCY